MVTIVFNMVKFLAILFQVEAGKNYESYSVRESQTGEIVHSFIIPAIQQK